MPGGLLLYEALLQVARSIRDVLLVVGSGLTYVWHSQLYGIDIVMFRIIY